MRRARPSSAFTLFEVMIALLVLTTAILATLAMLPIGVKAQQLARSQMFASSMAMTLMNNFHTPVDKFEGVSRLAPRYDGIPGTDTINPTSAPFQGWAGAIEEQEIHASAYQPNLEQQMGWLTGVLPVPMEIARRLDSDNDEIQKLIDQGGVLLYPDPNFMMGLNQGAAEDKTLQVAPAPELQKLIFAVTSLPQQNALSSLPAESFPWYEAYPFPPEWVSMQAVGRETRRLVGAGCYEGSKYFSPNFWDLPPIDEPWWFAGNARGGWPVPYNNGHGPYPAFNRSGMTMSGYMSPRWDTTYAGMVSWDDGGHGLYEPVKWRRPMRPGQEQDTYFSGDPVDAPDYNDNLLDPITRSTPTIAPGAKAHYTGNGFAQGRNWRFFAQKIGGIWNAGTGVYGVQTAWDAFQRLAGVDDANVSGNPRDTAFGSPWNDTTFPWNNPHANEPNSLFMDPMDPSAPAKFQRSGWLPIRALLTNPDFPSYEHLQSMNLDELNGTRWKPTVWPAASGPAPNIFTIHPFAPNSPMTSGDNLINLTWKAAAPRTVPPLATYEMRANYRDRAIDLWKAVMPRYAPQSDLSYSPVAMEMKKNMSAIVDDNDGGTCVDCNKYEYGPHELDKFKFIRPQDLDPRDLPIHPAQVLALSYLAHAAMMVTGYGPPFSGTIQTTSSTGDMDTIKVPWECLNWTYQPSPNDHDLECSLWSSERLQGYNAAGGRVTEWYYPAGKMATDAAGAQKPVPLEPNPAPPPPLPAKTPDYWEYPFDWEARWWAPGQPNPWILDPGVPYPGYASGPPYNNVTWDPRAVQQFPIVQQVKGQGITKDAMVVAEDVLPQTDGATFSTIKLYNDTRHTWVVYPGDELVFQASYYQWWYKYGRQSISTPANVGLNPHIQGDIYMNGDPESIWDGRYDPDGPGWWGEAVGTFPKYPNEDYKLQTFHVLTVNGVGENGGLPAAISGDGPLPTDAAIPANVITITVTPPVPWYPKNYNDARANVPLNTPPAGTAQIQPPNAYYPTGPGERDPISFHKNTLVRRVANPHDIAFARKVYEMAMEWAAAYAAESPYDAGAPRPANHQIMMDKPLALFDLFYDAGAGTGNGNAVRTLVHPPTSDGSSGGLSTRRTESFYRWMTGANTMPDSWFYSGSPSHGRNALSGFGPGRERQDYFEQMVYNNQLKPPSANQDSDRFWLTKPFAPFHRCRSLTFWSVDWKAYEDAETVPSAPIDIAKHDRYLRKDPTGADQYDFLAPYIDYGHSPLCGNPESFYVWVSPDRRRRYVDVVGGEAAGYLYQNWYGSMIQPRSGDHDGNGIPNSADVPATNGQPVTADVHLGHWGADRNGNGVLDVGPVPTGSRMRAVHVADFLYYDPVLRLHYGN